MVEDGEVRAVIVDFVFAFMSYIFEALRDVG